MEFVNPARQTPGMILAWWARIARAPVLKFWQVGTIVVSASVSAGQTAVAPRGRWVSAGEKRTSQSAPFSICVCTSGAVRSVSLLFSFPLFLFSSSFFFFCSLLSSSSLKCPPLSYSATTTVALLFLLASTMEKPRSDKGGRRSIFYQKF